MLQAQRVGDRQLTEISVRWRSRKNSEESVKASGQFQKLCLIVGRGNAHGKSVLGGCQGVSVRDKLACHVPTRPIKKEANAVWMHFVLADCDKGKHR